MKTLHCGTALTPDGWKPDVRVTVVGDAIGSVEIGTPALPGDERHAILLPAMPNVHSHAFQRAMAGLAEMRGPAADNFWSWREQMYRFALSVTPDEAEAIAAQLYVEMLEAGFCRVGEFHYLHHHTDGRPYANLGEMAERIAAAAGETGIGLTLLPVFYAHSTFGGIEPNPGQRRFINDVSRFGLLLEESREAVRSLNHAVVGVAPHSLRAVTPEELHAVIQLERSGPIHIHAAEQTKEVDDCLAWSGQRPVEWLLSNAPVDQRWCLIHSTHMTEAETSALAASGAVAGLCPITEANLGDGVFNGPAFRAAGGRFGIGSDSNIMVGVADELRQLEYAQRLMRRERNVMVDAWASTGHALFDAARGGGAIAMGVAESRIKAGAPADLVSLDGDHPTLAGKSGAQILDAWIFARGASVDCVWAAGRKLVENGCHISREPIRRRYKAAVSAIVART